MKLKTKPLLIAAVISAALSGSTYAFTANVAAGTTVTGETIDATGTESNNQTVYGTANDTTIEADNYQYVMQGGIANNSSAVNGGWVSAQDGGVLNNASVDANSSLSIGGGGISNNADIYGYMQNGGGTDTGTIIESGATYNLYGDNDNYSSVSKDTTIKNGGHVDISGTVEADNWDVSGSITVRRNIDDETDPIFNNATLNNGALVTLDYGAQMNGTTVNGGKLLVQSNSDSTTTAIINDTIINGGEVRIGQRGESDNTTVNNATTFYVDAGGTAHTTTLNTGATMQVNGSATDTTVQSGATATINAGNNGTVDPSTGGYMKDTVINGGELWNRFGIDDNTTINSGGVLDTGSALDGSWTETAISNNAIINDAGKQVIDNGGTSNNSTVNTGGTLLVQYDTHTDYDWDTTGIKSGTANATTVYGTMANNGGIDNGTDVKSGGQYTATGSLADNQKAESKSATIETGAEAALYENSLAENWTIQGTASLQDSSATITDSTVDGGTLWLSSGTATGTTIYSGTMSNAGGHDVDTVVNDGANYYLGGSETGAATAANLTINTGATANINSGTVTGATIDGAMYVTPDADYPTSTLQGDVAVNEGGTLTVYNGANTADADLTVNGSGAVFLSTTVSGTPNIYASQPTNYELGAMTLNGGSVVFDDTNTTGYSSLTLASLDGAGTFYMNTDLADLQGDFLNVTGQANGDFGVHVSDTGKSPTSDASLQIIQTGGGNANFTLANTGGVVDVGTYEYHLVDNGNGNWSLTPDAQPTPPDPDDGGDTPTPPDDGGDTPTPPTPPTPPEPTPVTPTITPSTAAVLNMATVDPLVFQAELGSVRHRLNETRSFSHDTNVWSDVYNTRNNASTSAGAGFDQTLTGLTIGADKSDHSGKGVVTRGLFFSYSHSDVDFDRGGDGNVDSYSVGAYASYLHDNGFYLDGILKANHFENDVNGRMTGGGAADGYYDTNGVGAHIQGGKYFHFGDTYIAPYAAVTAFTTDSSDYALSNDMQAHVGNERSVLAEAGVNVGHKFTLKNGATLQPYAGAAVTQEFIDDNKVDVNDDGHFTNDLSGTRGVYQVGLRAQLTERLTAHVDAAYAQGANVESPWVANAGVAWSF
jgi:outer membrane autotransporter protein